MGWDLLEFNVWELIQRTGATWENHLKGVLWLNFLWVHWVMLWLPKWVRCHQEVLWPFGVERNDFKLLLLCYHNKQSLNTTFCENDYHPSYTDEETKAGIGLTETWSPARPQATGMSSACQTSASGPDKAVYRFPQRLSTGEWDKLASQESWGPVDHVIRLQVSRKGHCQSTLLLLPPGGGARQPQPHPLCFVGRWMLSGLRWGNGTGIEKVNACLTPRVDAMAPVIIAGT